MDLIRTLLVYMAMLVSTSAVSSPSLTPLPPNFVTPSPSPTATMQPTIVPATPFVTLTPTASPTRTPTLAMGDRGENVRVLQVRLQELGYLSGRVDSIFGKQTKQALERFQRYNNLSVDGIAGPQTNQKLYNDRNVVRAPAEVVTPQPPVLASVPVYYRNSKGVLLGSDTVLVAQGSFTLRPNSRLVPANHSLISQNSVTVRVDEKGRATPASVSFTYQANSEVTPVVVPVFYRTDNNITLATDSISVMPGQTLTFTADSGRVPSGYTLITSGRLTVSVSAQGVATPGTLTFIYKKDAVNASISVNYRDTGGALLGQETKVFGPGVHTITANNSIVPSGYTLQGTNSQQVSVSSDGTASPNTINFVYKTSQVTVQVPIEYINQADSSILYSDVTSVVSGQSIQVTADNRNVPA
ncbi:MAG: peptidoglycan-binding protein, partial [Clostridiales bacterium]|nr:peptidoglycan-binding protein [Clostridiales bacterium]